VPPAARTGARQESEAPVSVYRVHFKWEGKDVELSARSLDMTHPYFVSIKDLVFSKETKVIINPAEDEIRKKFGGADHLMIPFQSVSLIEEILEDNESRIHRFNLVQESNEQDEDQPDR
jgi:hypothetical protein